MTVAREVAVMVLLVVAGLVTLLGSVGVLAMRDPLQRLHFIAPQANAAVLVLAALVVDGAGPEAWIKGIIVTALLALTNGVVTHATARAAFVHARGKWPPDPGQAEAASRGEPGGGG